MALILDAAKNGGATFYSIMKRTKINYKQLKRYLPSLVKMGFIEAEIKENKFLFRVNESGLAFLRQYNVLRGMLSSACTDDKQVDVVPEECAPSNVQQRVTFSLATRVARRV